jgi:hypothetical protein
VAKTAQLFAAAVSWPALSHLGFPRCSRGTQVLTAIAEAGTLDVPAVWELRDVLDVLK